MPQNPIDDVSGPPGRPPRGPTREERKELTREKIVAATIDAVAEHGLSQVTVSMITAGAGVSRGLANFHFRSKDELLVETLRFMTEEYLQSWKAAVAAAPPRPAEQLRALVVNDFDPAICNRKKAAVWFAFRGETKSRPTYLEVCTRADDEYDGKLRVLIAEIRREGGYGFDSDRAALGLASLIEGLWLDCLMYPATFQREDALETVLQYLRYLMPKHFGEPDAVSLRSGWPGANGKRG